jgi:hypothetical protein
MIRIVTLAAVAAFAATSANASEIRVSLVGKSQDQIHADLLSASRTVCTREMPTSPLIVGAYGRCVRETLKAAEAQLPA